MQAKQRINNAIDEAAPMGPASPLDTVGGHLGIAAGTRVSTNSKSPVASIEIEIRIGASLKATGIIVTRDGVIVEAPGGLFDENYTVVRVDGKRFTQSMEHLVNKALS